MDTGAMRLNAGSAFRVANGISFLTLTVCLVVGIASAGPLNERPVLGVWTADGQQGYTSSDTLETNQWYSASRRIWLNTGVMNAGSNAVSVTGLVYTCTLPAFLSPTYFDFENDTPFYIQWNAAYTSLICQAAAPLTNRQGWSTTVELSTTNILARPKVYAKRTVSATRLPPGEEVDQTVVCDLFIPPGALNGMGVFSVQLSFWDIETDGLSVSCYSNDWSSSAFFVDENQMAPVFVCTSPGTLAGSYSFTAHLKVTSYAEADVNYAPGVQVSYSRTQTEWARLSGVPSRTLEHQYDNGVWVGVSSPLPAIWYHQQMQDYTCWNIGPRYAPAEDDSPVLTQCELFRCQSVGYDGRTSSQFFFNAAGSDLVSATLTTPDNTTYSAEIEPDAAEFELIGLNTADFARFTNGTYTVRLYDFTNALRQTYSIPLAGSPVTETPHLQTPQGLCSTNSRPYLSWDAASDPEINATVLMVENSRLGNGELFNLWTADQPMPTGYQVAPDLFAGWSYELMFAHASQSTVNGAGVMSGYLASRYGIFNVQTQNLAFAHVKADVPRVFAGDDLDLSVFTCGFLPGTNYSFRVDFGDGFATNESWAVHRYDHAGTYAARVIVTDETGAAATGTVAMTAYDLPSLSAITPWGGNVVNVEFPTIEGAFYRLAHTADLSAPDWSGTIGTLTGDGTVRAIQDVQGEPIPKRFYSLDCDLNPEEMDVSTFPGGGEISLSEP